jgi:hypothetical protein
LTQIASVASLMLMSDALVVNIPKEDTAAPAMPSGGDMY